MKTKQIDIVLILISIVAVVFIGWLAWTSIGSGAVIVIALILGTGLVTGLFNILGAHLSERAGR